MAKREFLQLAHVYDPKKHHIAGWMLSEKLDGVRAFWDGGVSRGIPAEQVPWANVEKDARYKQKPIATGLWSRYGNTIQAPDYWLDKLPPFQIDGELWMGRGKFQSTVSIVKDMTPGLGWHGISFAAIDIPPINIVFADGVINTTNFKKTISLAKCRNFGKCVVDPVPLHIHQSFEKTYRFLTEKLKDNTVCYAHEQIQLPFSTDAAKEEIERSLADLLVLGGEGVILRKHTSTWTPERTHNCLKLKPFSDSEGTVIGYVWGRETDKGSKLLGKMGALVLKLDSGHRLELSGFTDQEREMVGEFGYDQAVAHGCLHPGKEVHEDYFNPSFPRGSRVTFKYRELTDGGVPKEARYFRKKPIGV